MSAPSFAQLAPEYAADWARMRIRPERLAAVDRAARRVAAARPRYEPVAAATRVPWANVGLLHMREASQDFSTHLHNGDPLDRRTTHVPAGRPESGRPPFSWEESAIDALRYDRLDRVGVWPIEVICYRDEGFNGFGPRYHGRKSGYLWAGSDVYDGGKYVEDSVWDSSVWDQQLGVLPVLRRMIDLGLFSLDAPTLPPMALPPTVSQAVPSQLLPPDKLQEALNVLLAGEPGWVPLNVDASIGKITRAAIRMYQAKAGLNVDGDAGPLTCAVIRAALAAKAN